MSCEDLFDAVERLEKQKYAVGEKEGIVDGQLKSWQTGFEFGWQQACHIHQELGRIEGLLSSLLLNCETTITPRIQKKICQLLTEIREWPLWDPGQEEKIEAKLLSVQTKSRFILQQMKISSVVIDRSIDGDF
ncbi:uncharacterized protein [Macrobrachium rosenbergii]|uniref:uncharacterized protein n=1 Tax=Macrobrachium rosenbergii TaxID=79674 RepID=UPI0034D3FAEC